MKGNLNWYDLFRINPSTSPVLKDVNREGKAMIDGEEKTYKRGFTFTEYTPWAKHILQSENHPLLGTPMSDYVNREDVRKALNIPTTLPGWNSCVPDDSKFNYHIQLEGSFWIYPILKGYS